ncbi:MAG: hypothetical protein WA816_06940 [Bacteroidales bacterium]
MSFVIITSFVLKMGDLMDGILPCWKQKTVYFMEQPEHLALQKKGQNNSSNALVMQEN